ncbi:capsular biosynthesis protein [Ectothiorhodospira shaposhnikovii]|uniref:polysaccharide biosynthesis tyrosine autokinase n=1 Tax=Ectothiorhodospira shaposhnikovii TaxID=1054 RepID=UPI001903B805|nr:polysaccharide biosynthesis tyrosine autokinase [Ectothiorhodospira shaposhnikovii]MBK1674080.1 capsular biosynthesis protein [Ectothiorhodospira shaposhnikovii]
MNRPPPHTPINEPPHVGHPPAAPVEDDGDTIHIGELIGTVLQYKWLIAAITALALCGGIFAAFTATPIYRSDALLQVEEKGKSLSALQDVQAIMSDSVTVSAELEILRSRMILGRVVDRLGLEIFAQPVYPPVFGDAFARRHGGSELAAPRFGLERYAWGGERIRIESLDVPSGRIGQGMALLTGHNGMYTLRDRDGHILVTGRVGEPASGSDIQIFISELHARPGTEFTVGRRSRGAAIDALRGQFEVRERGRGSGVLELALRGPDRASLTTVLDEIMNAYVRQNVEHRSAEAESTLVFLESQLPLLKSQLDAAEAAYNNYRQTRGSVDLTMETRSVLGSIVEVDNDIIRLQQQREELRQRYTAEHPRMVALDAQILRLSTRRNQLEGQVSELPDTQQTALRLRRDVEVSTALYTSLLHSAQQLRVARAGTVGDSRIIDSAVVSRGPVAPSQQRILLISVILGLMAALGLVFLIRALRVVVEDPETIEKHLGLPVYATIPHSKEEEIISRQSRRGRISGQLLAVTRPTDDAVESLRSLRTTIHFALLDASRGSLLITGPSQGVGKSFISKNLGVVLAQSGKTVVLVDADLRKGHMHREFSISREGGVTEYIAGTIELPRIIRATPQDGLKVITTGQIPPNPSELLMHQRFTVLLDTLSDMFDIVIVDAPPVLAVSDAAIIGRNLGGATLMVARAGRHPIHELEQSVKRLSQAGVAVKGIVFNDLDVNRQRYRYGYRGYVYRYGYRS